MKKIIIYLFNIFLISILFSCSSTRKTETIENSIIEQSAEEEIILQQEVFTGVMPNISGTVYGDLLGDGNMKVIPGIEITFDNEQFVISFTDGSYLISNPSKGKHIISVHDSDGKINGHFKDKSYEINYEPDNEKYFIYDIYLERYLSD